MRVNGRKHTIAEVISIIHKICRLILYTSNGIIDLTLVLDGMKVRGPPS